jgi:hypothetical protein
MMLPSVDDILEERAMRAAIAPAAEDERRGRITPLWCSTSVWKWSRGAFGLYRLRNQDFEFPTC